MLAALLSIVLSTLGGAKFYDHVDHPPSWYDREVTSIDRPAAGADTACLDRLNKAHIKFRLLANVKGVVTPIEVMDTSLGLVKYRRGPLARRRFILDCHTVEVLASLGRRLRKVGIATVYWSSAWRYSYRKGTKKLSAHAHGTALDIVAIDGKFGYAAVKSHYERGKKGCGKNNDTKPGRYLMRFGCALVKNHPFDTLYTPDTDAMHTDHFHVEGPDAAIKYRTVFPPPSRLLYVLAGIAVVLFGAAGYWWWHDTDTDTDTDD